MLDQRRVVAQQPDERREQLFTERYEVLLAWAMGLTNQQREAAEDLVQDAFVQFVLGRTRLEEIENIDGYLRRMLRYMHVSRLSRSAQHLHEAALSVADYDSGRLGWTAIEPPRRMQASEELLQICTYACSRKESSRAGSVFILRFFHEYFPTEIAAILNSTRHCVDQWQGLARREAKLFMNEPRRLSFVNARTLSDPRKPKYLKSDCDLMLELRLMIFKSCSGTCLSEIELDEIYNRANSNALTTAKLAHIVSCPECLDLVNKLLGLPLLAQRYRTEAHEPKEPPSNASGGGASGGGPGELSEKFANRLRETHEHKPQELRISVNGSQVSSLKVSSELSELNLNLPTDDPVEFVEISSERGMQLLFFSIDPARPQPEQWAWIELSDGRSLEAGFGKEVGPTLHVVYKDPVPAEAFITGDILSANALSSPLFVVPALDDFDEPYVGTPDAIGKDRSWIVRLFNKFRHAGREVISRETAITTQAEALALAGTVERAPLFNLQRLADERTRSWQPLGLIILLVSVIAVAGFLYFKNTVSPTLSAAVILEKASAAESNSRSTADTVKHRIINLEERRSAEGAVVARRKIEIWSNHAKGLRAQRLFDDSNRLIAAAWQKADGSRTVYHHGSRPRPEAPLTTPLNLLLSLENIWQLEPASETFAILTATTADIEVEERLTTYVLTFNKERVIGASRLLQATLTINKSDLHPIEQTLLVQRGSGESGELREYRFAEASSEQIPLPQLAPNIFEVEPELTGGTAEPGKPGDWALRDANTNRVLPAPSASAPPVASAELEVDVTYLLNQEKADRNEQVTLTRSAGGSLRVEGVVETEQRKQEFLRALAPVANNPAVKIEIRSVADAVQRPANSAIVSIREAEVTESTIAAYDELKAYFEKRASGSIEEEIRNYTSRMIDHSYQALFQTVELKKVIAPFANVDMRTVTPDARVKWLSMVKGRAGSIERATAVLRREIQPVFFSGAGASASEEAAIHNDAELARAVEQLHKLATANNDAIRSAMTISSKRSVTALKSAQFWNSLLRAEKLAARIRQYGG